MSETPSIDPDTAILEWLSSVLLSTSTHLSHRVTAAQVLLGYYKRWGGPQGKYKDPIALTKMVLREMVIPEDVTQAVIIGGLGRVERPVEDPELEARLVAASMVLS